MNNIVNQFSSIEQLTDKYLINNKPKKSSNDGLSFEEVLKQKQQAGLRFSKHASARLDQRNINLSEDQSQRLEKGVSAAEDKGVNESLVLVDNLAFIVNIPNRTVVTAMDQAETNSNVFTNIDGAVIM